MQRANVSLHQQSDNLIIDRGNVSIDWVERARALKPQVRNFINGRYAEIGGSPLEKRSSRDGELLCRFGAGEAREVEQAVGVARRAFEDGRWSKLPMTRRKDVLYKLIALIEQHREEFALLECLDVGKPISDALNLDVTMAIGTLKYNAEAADKFCGKVYSADSTSLSYQLRRPRGVVGAIIGWNFPLVLAAAKIGPALAMGNTLVLKPSQFTSLSAARVAELALEAGVPEGVFNVVCGAGAVGAALAKHRDVELVSFTGSSATGKKLLIASGESNMKRLILECGGKAPNIVFDDAPDLNAVADAVVMRGFWNQGQVCTASSRLLIHESIKAQFLPLIMRKVAELVPGDPLKPETRFGAVVNHAHQKKIMSYIESGEQEGARIVYRCSSPMPFEGGAYVAPTLFDQVSTKQRIAQEEIFGPVLSAISFRDEEEALRIANDTIYGLSAILWTQDLGRAHRMTQGIRAGTIIVNATGKPMGGPGRGVISVGGHKESGLGVEGGLKGLEEYTSETAVQFFV